MKYDVTDKKVIERLVMLQRLFDAEMIFVERCKQKVKEERERIQMLRDAARAVKHSLEKADVLELELEVADVSNEVLDLLKSVE